jgi:hypothetical protein
MQLTKTINGKKFMWDGNILPDEKPAQEIAKKYKDDGFETEVNLEDGKYFVFTRRIVKEVIVEGNQI